MSLEEVLEAGMIGAITLTMLVFLFLIAAKVRGGSRIRGDFALLFSVFVVGWLAAEVLAFLAPPDLNLLAEVLHFSVILVFTVFLALRWRWAFQAALQEAGS